MLSCSCMIAIASTASNVPWTLLWRRRLAFKFMLLKLLLPVHAQEPSHRLSPSRCGHCGALLACPAHAALIIKSHMCGCCAGIFLEGPSGSFSWGNPPRHAPHNACTVNARTLHAQILPGWTHAPNQETAYTMPAGTPSIFGKTCSWVHSVKLSTHGNSIVVAEPLPL